MTECHVQLTIRASRKLCDTVFKAMGTRREIRLYARAAKQAAAAATNVFADVERLAALYRVIVPAVFPRSSIKWLTNAAALSQHPGNRYKVG